MTEHPRKFFRKRGHELLHDLLAAGREQGELCRRGTGRAGRLTGDPWRAVDQDKDLLVLERLVDEALRELLHAGLGRCICCDAFADDGIGWERDVPLDEGDEMAAQVPECNVVPEDTFRDEDGDWTHEIALLGGTCGSRRFGAGGC